MLRWGGRRPNSPVYGVTVVGLEARFFIMRGGSTVLNDYGATVEAVSVKENAARVQEILSDMKIRIKQDV
ncbi:uncharacterized protein N7518_009274 [Penicillium psychrosexuale]|uniref:uncharacterized protein n=1 Tax=Penicillium psychrosexuale TaxID=1002107 RepID=UPI002545001C|nr:uncharacterized protein N7518_009274 [Penicillium psychrosexuale]KAJ5783597.1 hypothetical protein N7518_009274 [Penicillium psychrosexuale]